MSIAMEVPFDEKLLHNGEGFSVTKYSTNDPPGVTTSAKTQNEERMIDSTPTNIKDIVCRKKNETTEDQTGAVGKKQHKGYVRKRLGCRRRHKDMLSAEEQKGVETVTNQTLKDERSTFEARRLARRKEHMEVRLPSRKIKPRRRLIFTSPRLMASDDDLFPSDHSLYQESKQRWQEISNQAGRHRQDGTVMNIGRRPASASVYRAGIVRYAAVRVRSLNLWLDYEKDTLPEWLYMIRDVFINLEHITLTEDVFWNEDEMTVSARMRRLYVLSILPNLKSIDDMVVTSEERQLANPNGYEERKDSKRSVNVPSSSSSVSEEDRVCSDTSRATDEIFSIDTHRSSNGSEIEVAILPNETVGEMKRSETEPTINSCSTSNSECIVTAISDDHGIHHRCALPMSFTTNFVETSQHHGIEILEEKFRELKQSETDTTANTTPTNSETVSVECDPDDNVVGEISDIGTNVRFKGGEKGKEAELDNVSPTDVTSSNLNDPHDAVESRAIRDRTRTLHQDVIKSIEIVSDGKSEIESSVSSRHPSSTKLFGRNQVEPANSRNTKSKKDRLKACTPVQRQSKQMVSTPQVGCCYLLTNDSNPKSQFLFSSVGMRRCLDDTSADGNARQVSANKKIPPSKSLSSPFPMQFRERRMPASTKRRPVNLVVKTSESTDTDFDRSCSRHSSRKSVEMETITSPSSAMTSQRPSPKTAQNMLKSAAKGDLPPPCPSASSKRYTNTELMSKQRKVRAMQRRRFRGISKESARATSVMDLDDDDDE